MLGFAPFKYCFNVFFDLLPCPPMQEKVGGKDNRIGRQVKIPIAEAELPSSLPTNPVPYRHECYRFHYILDFPPIGAGIHFYGASHAARDAGAELHACKAFPERQTNQLGKWNPCFGMDGNPVTIILNTQIIKPFEENNHPPVAPVPHYQVGAVSYRRK